jgi:hypothetical protein
MNVSVFCLLIIIGSSIVLGAFVDKNPGALFLIIPVMVCLMILIDSRLEKSDYIANRIMNGELEIKLKETRITDKDTVYLYEMVKVKVEDEECK